MLFSFCPFGVPVEYGGKVLTGVAFLYLCHLFGRALCYNGTSACASLRAHVNYIVRALYDVEVVLYDHYRAAAVRKPLQYIKKPLHIRNVKSGGRLVQHVERLTGIPAGKLGSELYPLRLAAR